MKETDDDCIVEIEFRPGEPSPVLLTENWYNTDCVGPSHGGTEQRALSEEQAIERLVDFVEEPFETNS